MEKIIDENLIKVKEKLEEYNDFTRKKILRQKQLKKYYEILKNNGIEVL